MAEPTTIARPYAKAAFEHALEADQLAIWSEILNQLAIIIADKNAISFINNPLATSKDLTQLLTSLVICKDDNKLSPALQTFVNLLAENKRLLLLPEIAKQFEELRSREEKTLNANVISFAKLTDEQKKKLSKSLSARLERRVELEIKVDESLLGGAIIQAGDLVIDGSVRSKLEKLRASLSGDNI